MSFPAAQTPRLLARLADRCDEAGFDLWAANLRGVLTLPTSEDQAWAMRAEALRLLDKPSIQDLYRKARRQDQEARRRAQQGAREEEASGKAARALPRDNHPSGYWTTPATQGPASEAGAEVSGLIGEQLVDGLQTILDRLNLEAPMGPSPAQPLYEALRNLADQLQLDGQARWLARLRYVALDTSFTALTRLERLDHVICSALMDESLPAGLLTACRVRLEAIVDAERSAKMATYALWPPAPKSDRSHGSSPDPIDERGTDSAEVLNIDHGIGPLFTISTEEMGEED